LRIERRRLGHKTLASKSTHLFPIVVNQTTRNSTSSAVRADGQNQPIEQRMNLTRDRRPDLKKKEFNALKAVYLFFQSVQQALDRSHLPSSLVFRLESEVVRFLDIRSVNNGSETDGNDFTLWVAHDIAERRDQTCIDYF
jgi:hypothetical protein